MANQNNIIVGYGNTIGNNIADMGYTYKFDTYPGMNTSGLVTGMINPQPPQRCVYINDNTRVNPGYMGDNGIRYEQPWITNPFKHRVKDVVDYLQLMNLTTDLKIYGSPTNTIATDGIKYNGEALFIHQFGVYHIRYTNNGVQHVVWNPTNNGWYGYDCDYTEADCVALETAVSILSVVSMVSRQ